MSIAAVCGVCPAGCGVNVHFDNEKISRLTPLKDHPLGVVCPRGAQAHEIVYSNDRVLYPQKRVGARGEGRFECIGWEEAYDLWITALKKTAKNHGPEAIATYTGRGNFEFGLNEFFAPRGTSESSANAVLFPFGSPNTAGVGSLCYVSQGMIAPQATFGRHLRGIYEDVDHADLILVWGANPATDSPPANLRRIKHAQKRGARIVVIDHRRTETARSINAQWIGIRPGTDGALVLGILHIMIANKTFDHDFVENWTHGFAELAQYVQSFDLMRVESITGVPAVTIHELARSIAEAKGCSILMYTGLEYSNSGVQAIRALWILQALGGHLDVPGGKLFRMRDQLMLHRNEIDPPPRAPKPVGAEEYPLYYATRKEAHAALLPRAILDGKPYPVRAMIISGSSILTAWPNPAQWRRAFSSLDFLVVVDRFPTADSRYADLVLPAATLFESESYVMHDGYIQLRSRVIPPRGEARPDYLIFAELARRLGYGERFPQTEEAMIIRALEGSGITLETLRKNPAGIPFAMPEMHYQKYKTGEIRPDGKPGFLTPTGKFEITSEWFREHGYDPLPIYTEPREGPLGSPETARHFPLVFNSGARTQTAFRSQHMNIPSLIARQPHPQVHIHSQDAAARGIQNGDKVRVSSPRGKVFFWACVTEDIVPGVVEVNMGGGGAMGPEEWQNSNVNELTDMKNCDSISGFPVYKALLCEVEKIHGVKDDLCRN